MAFVGGVGNIAISTSLPPSFCALCCKHLIVYGIHISFFYACLRLRFLDVETNPGRGGLFPLSADYSVVICGAWPGNLVDWPWRRLSKIYCCIQRLWSLICVTCRSCWFPDLVALSYCAGKDASGPRDGGVRTRWIWAYGAFRQPKFECGSCEMLVFRVCGVRQLICVKWFALWPVEHAVLLDCAWVRNLEPSIKISRPQCQSPSIIHTLPWSVS